VDKWLPAQPHVETAEAQARLLRTFLSAFGPATAHDFSKWSGIKTSDARLVMQAIADEILEVSVDGASGSILRADLKELRKSTLDLETVRLLGPFDSFLLAHATKEHLVEPRHYKRVYRPQGWISLRRPARRVDRRRMVSENVGQDDDSERRAVRAADTCDAQGDRARGRRHGGVPRPCRRRSFRLVPI
jgi:hypothetical protein